MQPLGDLLGSAAVGASHEHDELVAAEPGDGVAVADAAAQPLGRPRRARRRRPGGRLSLTSLKRSRSQNSRATGDPCACGPVPAGAGQQRAAVGQPGQPSCAAWSRAPRARPARGDVLDHRDEVERCTAPGEGHGRWAHSGSPPPVRSAWPPGRFPSRRPAGRRLGLVQRPGRGPGIAWKVIPARPCRSRAAGRTPVALQQDAVQRDDRDADGRARQRAEPVLGGLQRSSGVPFRGHVDGGDDGHDGLRQRGRAASRRSQRTRRGRPTPAGRQPGRARHALGQGDRPGCCASGIGDRRGRGPR